MKASRPWIVTPHGPLRRLDAGLWIVDSDVPGLPATRRMAIVRRGDGTLLFFNAIPLSDPVLDEVRALGRPTYLVVPQDGHAIDAPAFRERLGLSAYTTAPCRERVAARMPVAGTIDEVPADPGMSLSGIAGVKSAEACLLVHHEGGGTSLMVCDVFQNNRPDKTPFLLRLLGFAGPRVTPLFKRLFLVDKQALREHLLRLAATPNLTRLIPTHGDLVEADPAGALRAAAAGL